MVTDCLTTPVLQSIYSAGALIFSKRFMPNFESGTSKNKLQ